MYVMKEKWILLLKNIWDKTDTPMSKILYKNVLFYIITVTTLL